MQRATAELRTTIRKFEKTALKWLDTRSRSWKGRRAKAMLSMLKPRSKKDQAELNEVQADGQKAGGKEDRLETDTIRLVEKLEKQTSHLRSVLRFLPGYDPYPDRHDSTFEKCCGADRRSRRRNLDKLKSRAFGFVLLESNLAARFAVYRMRHSRQQSWFPTLLRSFIPRPAVELAPELLALDWSNVVKNRVWRVIATAQGLVGLTGALIVFTGLQVVIASLANAAAWTSVFPALQSFQKEQIMGVPVGKYVFAALVGGVPPALATVTRSLLPLAVSALARIRGARTWSRLVLCCIAWLYIAQVGCQVTAFTLAGTLLNFAAALYTQSAQTGLAPWPLLKSLRGFPQQAIQACLHSSKCVCSPATALTRSYWLSSFGSNIAVSILDLVNPWRLFRKLRVTKFVPRSRPPTVRELAQENVPERTIELDKRSADLLLELAVVFTYSSMAPLIAVLGFLSVLVQYRVAHVQMTRVYERPPACGGELWRALANRLLFSVGLVQTVILSQAMGLQFGVRGALLAFLPLVLITAFKLQLSLGLLRGRGDWSADDKLDWGADVLHLVDLISSPAVVDAYRDRLLYVLRPVDFEAESARVHHGDESRWYDEALKAEPRMPRLIPLPPLHPGRHGRPVDVAEVFRRESAEIARAVVKDPQSAAALKPCSVPNPWIDCHGTHPAFEVREYIKLAALINDEDGDRLRAIGAVAYPDQDCFELGHGWAG